MSIKPTKGVPRSTNTVITGMGLACSLGLDRAKAWRELCEANGAIGRLTALEQQPAGQALGGQAPELCNAHRPELPREVRYLRHALAESLRDAELSQAHLPYAPQRCGLVFGTTLHGMRAGGRHFRTNDFEPLRQFQGGAVLDLAGRELGLRGPAITTCAACSSGLTSLALAVTLLRNHELDLVIAGGYDPISEYAYGGFGSLRLIAEGDPKPFCRDRDGMKLGEGYGAVVLERAEDAQARQAPQHWPILGIGETADAHHLTQPRPDGDGAARAMEAALSQAGLGSSEIDLICAHATGTPDNEVGETAALRRVFAEHLAHTPITALKSHLGHTLGGAGTIELILAITALAQQRVPPTAHIRREDLEFGDLQFVTGPPKQAQIERIINLSFGFGGANTALIVGAQDSAGGSAASAAADSGKGPEIPGSAASAAVSGAGRSRKGPEMRRAGEGNRKAGGADGLDPSNGSNDQVVITGLGVVLPECIGNDAFAAAVRDPNRPRISRTPPSIDDEQLSDLLSTRRVRRMSDYVKLSLAATRLACTHAGLEVDPGTGQENAGPFNDRCGAILGTAHGSADYCAKYYRQIVREGIDQANPMLFAEGVPNAGAAHLSLMLGLKGPCQTIIGSRTAGLDALRLASLRIAEGTWDRAIVSAAEEATDLLRWAYKHCAMHSADGTAGDPFDDDHGFVMGSGAATLVLERREIAEARQGPVHGSIVGNASAYHRPDDYRQGTEQVARLCHDLGYPHHVITSASSTGLGRLERAGIEQAAKAPADRHGQAQAAELARGQHEQTSAPTITSFYGQIAETFSVTPLAAIAATLLTNPPHARDFTVLTSDPAGPLAATRVTH